MAGVGGCLPVADLLPPLQLLLDSKAFTFEIRHPSDFFF